MRGSVQLAIAITCGLPALTSAQVAAISHATATITAADLSRHIGILAADSMLGRATPSRELELTAQYVADQFRQLGLRPAGSERQWLQRYPIPGQIRVDEAKIRLYLWTNISPNGRPVVKERGSKVEKTIDAAFSTVAHFAPATALPSLRSYGSGSQTCMLVAGRQTAESVRRLDLYGKVVFYIPPSSLDTAGRRRVTAALGAQSRGVIVASEDDSAHFAARFPTPPRPLRIPLIDDYMQDAADVHSSSWAVEVRSGVLRDFLTSVGIDLARIRADSAPVAQEFPIMAGIIPALRGEPSERLATAPNVVGVLEGTDSLLKREYVVWSAHMDHVGVLHGQTDSIANGADDNAAGVAGLLALAKAFSQPGMRPRRSLIFLATSGGAKDKENWGSNFFLYSSGDLERQNIVTNITLDRIGRSAGDSVGVDGVDDARYEPSLAWILAAHPELGLTVTRGGTAIHRGADHFPFVNAMIPSLYFHQSTHAGDIETRDTLPLFDIEHAVRILRLAFFMGQEIANADRRPQWSPEGRKQLLQIKDGHP